MVRPDIKNILQDTELLSIVGAINIEWDEIEVGLWRMFWNLLGGEWATSYAIFFSQQNHRARRDMLEALATTALAKDARRLKKLRSLIARVKRAAKKRNDFTHGVWDEVQSGPSVELRRTLLNKDIIHGKSDAYKKSDLKALRDQLTKLKDDIDAFYQ